MREESPAMLLDAAGVVTVRDGARMLQCVPTHEKRYARCRLPRFAYASKQQMAQCR